MPKKGSRARQALEEFKGSRKKERGRKKSDLELLKSMLAEARKIDSQEAEVKGISKQLIRPRTFTKQTSGKITEGRQSVKAFNRELTREFEKELHKWVRSHRGKYPLWQIRMVVAQFSESEDFGDMLKVGTNPKATRVFVRGEHANHFIAQQVITTPALSSIAKVWPWLSGKLEELHTSDSVNFVLTVDVYNYRRRSADEIRARETAARRKRPRFKKKDGKNVRLRNQFQ